MFLHQPVLTKWRRVAVEPHHGADCDAVGWEDAGEGQPAAPPQEPGRAGHGPGRPLAPWACPAPYARGLAARSAGHLLATGPRLLPAVPGEAPS